MASNISVTKKEKLDYSKTKIDDLMVVEYPIGG